MFALPDPLRKPDGARITNPAEWPAQREKLKELAERLMYGKRPVLDQPPEMTVISRAEEAGGAVIAENARIDFGIGGEAFSVDVEILRPSAPGKFPVITYNNHRVPGWPTRADAAEVVARRGYAVAEFAREMIAPDAQISGFAKQQPLERYPRLGCGAIMAWGFGHSLVIDCLQNESWAGLFVATGCSRGGKAALAAGIFDERIAVTAPIVSGCGGTGMLRYVGGPDGSRQDPAKCEVVGSLATHFPDWFIPAFAAFGNGEPPHTIEKEFNLPFDAHTLRALVAPRAIIDCEGLEDIWANLFGTQMAWRAAQPVFDLLGVPERNAFHWREGPHAFLPHDWDAVLGFCDTVLRGKPGPHDINVPFFDEKEWA